MLSIVKESLDSKVVRKVVGTRIFKALLTPDRQEDQGGLGIIRAILNPLAKFVGFILRDIGGFLSWSLSGIWGIITNTLSYIYTFNWNITDEAIDQQVQGYWNAVGGSLGSTVGSLVGWIGCGVLPGLVMLSFNEALGAYVLKEVGEEAVEEIASNVAATIKLSFQAAAQKMFGSAFKNIRKWLKQDNNVVAQILFGERYQEIKDNWGKKGGSSFTFAGVVEQKVESIPNLFWRNFVEEALEEAWDACIEAGYVVINSYESFMAAQKLNNQALLGQERIVEIFPDRANENEKIILAGPETLIKPAIIQTLAHYTLLDDRDVGQFVGMPSDDYTKARPFNRRLVIQYYSVPNRPFNRSVAEARYTISDVKRSKMDWQTVKVAAGGSNGFMWGPCRATATLSNGRQMACYGSTEDAAEDILRSLATLGDFEIWTVNTGREKKTDKRAENPEMQKEPTRLYPAYATLYTRKSSLGSGGRIRRNGKKVAENTYRFNLFTSSEPPNFEEKIAEMFSGLELIA